MMNYIERITPEQAGISSFRILELIDKLEAQGMELHSMMMLRHGKIFAEAWWKPYNEQSPHIMFSFTKSLTSTAIGFAVQEGLLSLDDKLVDIFPDKLPELVSDNLKKSTLRHLLTMSCGHDSEIRDFGLSENWIESFLAHPFVHEPGTKFLYNTAGTTMLAAALKRASGLDLMEFLKERLFDKIGIGDVPCITLPDGTQMGGAGSRLTTEEMARFMLFMANRGEWNGEQLLDESWFDMATTPQIDNSYSSNDPDWNKGYGFQLWMCDWEGAYRADGAFGQFGIVCPEEDIILIFSTAAIWTQKLLSTLWNDFLPYFSDEPLPENRDIYLLMKYNLAKCEIKPLLSRRIVACEEHNKKKYIPDGDYHGCWADYIGGAGICSSGIYKNMNAPFATGKLEALSFNITDKELSITATIDGEEDCLPIGYESHFLMFTMFGKVYGTVGGWLDKNHLEVMAYCAEAASGRRIIFEFEGNKLYIRSYSTLMEFGGLNDGDPGVLSFTLSE